ncbi:hypothetical protein GcC1_163013 [Golovinomyces cichoracearum]|uniref:Uncharacterized protein n=1 Tax=Golovinomyces cichoracearum TaxID=62708 RepID=A0A420HTC4_9PEZI|nr:hypothetical protein GcC1_163013 [Golovinomyces cichoracearum]
MSSSYELSLSLLSSIARILESACYDWKLGAMKETRIAESPKKMEKSMASKLEKRSKLTRMPDKYKILEQTG